jgi:hypothetical protein
MASFLWKKEKNYREKRKKEEEEKASSRIELAGCHYEDFNSL